MREGLSEAGLRSFRVAATLAAVAPGVRLRICDGPRLLTEVHRPPLPTDADHREVPPCVFRLAVAGDESHPSPPQPGWPGASVRVGFHHDELTAVTLVHVTGPAGDIDAAARDLDVLEATLARCVTTELLDDLADPGRPPDSRARPPA